MRTHLPIPDGVKAARRPPARRFETAPRMARRSHSILQRPVVPALRQAAVSTWEQPSFFASHCRLAQFTRTMTTSFESKTSVTAKPSATEGIRQ